MKIIVKLAVRTSMLGWFSAVLVACGGGGSNSVDSAMDAGSGVCGTYAEPGTLKVTGRTPAIGASVLNQSIVHSFVVENAPAIFTAFTLRYGDTHTAGISTPFDPAFQVTVSGSSLIYQMTIDAWSQAPGHVEIVASGDYETLQGCSWVFPTPLFSYNVTPGLGLDAGVAAEAKSAVDGASEGAMDAETRILALETIPTGGKAGTGE